MVTLLSRLLAENETAECLTGAIIHTFKEGGKLLEGWRMVFTRLFPHCKDFINMIPQSSQLTLASL
jgi:hypothetical protein